MKIAAILGATALLSLAAGALPANATTTVYSDRTSFAAQLGSSVTDNYENPGYVFFQNDAQMSAVLGETTYQATGFQNVDIVSPDGAGGHYYCAGCNGSFRLGFGGTSVAVGGGVFGAGFDLRVNETFDALVTFADGSSTDYQLPSSPTFFEPEVFWGITSDLGIASIYLGHNGQSGQDGSTGIDNLQIGAASTAGGVPEPAAWALMLMGFGALGSALRRGRRHAAIA